VASITGASSLWNDNLDNPVNNQPGFPWNGVVELTQPPVNDAPSFAKGADQTVLEDAGPQTVTGWASGINAGPPDEAGQTVNFLASNDNNALFSAQPAIDAAGTLTYTPAANANGITLVTVTLHDSGGTANGGVDSSAQTLSITVNPVNDPPSFTKGADQAVNEDAGSQTVAGWATGISAGHWDEVASTKFFQ
jgi:VCBS repeat-containing protein